MKTVSVIITAYNMEKYIAKSVCSVRDQLYRDLEIIVVNDGSTDGTPAILDEIASGDERIRVIHRENGGVSAARNTGLAAATGDYIAWLDGDDTMTENAIGMLMCAAGENGAQIAVGNYDNISFEGEHTPYYGIKETRVLTSEQALHLLVQRKISQSLCANVVKRELYKGMHFEEGRLFEDILNTYRLYEGAEKVVIIGDKVMNRQRRPNSISNEKTVVKRLESMEAYIESQRDVLCRKYPEWEKDFVFCNYRGLYTLCTAVVRHSRKDFLPYRDRIRKVCAYFRSHTDWALGENRSLPRRIQYALLTSGTRTGMILSRVWGRLAFNSKKNFLD